MGKYLDKIRQAGLVHEDDLPAAGSKDQAAVTINTAHSEARSVYWETGDGKILGPAVPECLARLRGKKDSFWVIVTYQGLPRWIRSDRLQSKQAFDTQRPVQRIEPIRGGPVR
jgi:hypothetical protein